MALDDFNRANGGLGANWTTVTAMAAPAVDTNQWSAATPGASGSHAYYNALTPGNDQFAIAIYRAGADLGVTGRVSTGAQSWYEFNWDSFGGNHYSIWKIVAGVPTQLGANVAGTIAAGDVMRIEVSGTTITGLINGVSVISRTDSSLTSGRIGLVGYDTANRFDDFDGGTLSSTVTFASTNLPDFFPRGPSAYRTAEFRPVLPPGIPNLGVKVVLPEWFPQPRPLRTAEFEVLPPPVIPTRGVKVVLPEWVPPPRPLRSAEFRGIAPLAIPTLGSKVVLPEWFPQPRPLRVAETRSPFIVVASAPTLGKTVLPERAPIPPVVDRSYYARVDTTITPFGFNVVGPEAAVGSRWGPMGVADAGAGMPILIGSVELPDFLPPMFSLAGLAGVVSAPRTISVSVPILGTVELPDFMPPRFSLAGLAGAVFAPQPVSAAVPIFGTVELPDLVRPLWPYVRSELIRPLAFVAPPIVGTVELPDLFRPVWPFIATETFRSPFIVATAAAPLLGSVTLPERFPPIWPIARSELVRPMPFVAPPARGMVEAPNLFRPVWPFVATETFRSPFIVVGAAAPVTGNVTLPERPAPIWPIARSELIRPMQFVAPPAKGVVVLPERPYAVWPRVATETFRSPFIVAAAAPVRGSVVLPERFPQPWPFAQAASSTNPQRPTIFGGTVVLPSGSLAAQRWNLRNALLVALRPIAALIGVVGPNHTTDPLALASTAELLQLAQTMGVYVLATTKEIT